MKQNDYLVATMNNPEWDSQDFRYLSGLNLNNTLLLPKEEYLKSQYIQDSFKDKEGNFDKNKFDELYAKAASSFSEFSDDDNVDNYKYSMWDVTRPADAPVKEEHFDMSTEKNPSHITVGVAGINKVGLSDKSVRELALDSPIFDPATGKFLKETPNDLSLTNNPIKYFKSIFSEPLVYATYDKDTKEIDPETGKEVLHKKGEYKVNEDGEYYTEKLNGRSLIGKEVVSALDYLTPEDSTVNKYDPFDSDGLDLSITLSVVKNVAAVAPLFMKRVAPLYAGLLIGRELMKTFPMMYGIVKGLMGSENTDSKLLNTMLAYGETFTGSTSDYAKLNTFAFENFASLASDVALLWGQLKLIVDAFSKIAKGGLKALLSAEAKALTDYKTKSALILEDAYAGKISPSKLASYVGTAEVGEVNNLIRSGKWADSMIGKAALNKYMPAALKAVEARMKAGQDLSLVYMALVSNTDVYQSAKEHGATSFEAAAMALGSTLGMFSVDKYAHLGEMFFDQEPARQAIRQAARLSADELMLAMGTQGIKDVTTKKGFMNLVEKGINAGKKTVNRFYKAAEDRTLPLLGKAVGEGLEEVSEELVADFSKSLFELGGLMGVFSQTDYGAWDNAFARYSMSFLGGAVGGGMFGAVEAWLNRNNATKEFNSELTYLLRQGKKGEIINELTRLRDKGQLGSRLLSFQTTTDGDGKPVYLTAEKESDSQNNKIYDTLVKTINQLDFILNDNGLKLDEGDLFDKMVQGEYRAAALSDFLKGNEENVKNLSYITRYQQDFLQLAEKITAKQAEIDTLLDSTPDKDKRGTEFDEKLSKLKEEKEELLKQRDYLFGEGSLGYVLKMLFAMDTGLSGLFMSINRNQYIRDRFGKSAEELTEAEKLKANAEWEEYRKNKKDDLDLAFNQYLSMEGKINPSVQEAADKSKEWYSKAENFLRALTPLMVDQDMRLDGESDEDYETRNTIRDGETNEDFARRQAERNKKVDQAIELQVIEWIDSIPVMDRGLFRTVLSKLRTFSKNIAQKIIQSLQVTNNPDLTHKIWTLLETANLEEPDKIKQVIRNTVTDNIDSELRDKKYLGREGYNWMNIKAELDSTPTPVKGYVTYGDLFNYLTLLESRDELHNIDEIKEHLNGWDGASLDFDLAENDDAQTVANIDFIDWYEKAKTDPVIRDSKWVLPMEVSGTYIDNERDRTVADLLDGIEDDDGNRVPETGLNYHVDNIIKELTTNPLIKRIKEFESSVYKLNPIEPIANAISKVSTNRTTDINEFLQEIYTQYHDGENPQAFQLTAPQEAVLTLFIRDLDMAKAFVHAASTSPTYLSPVGHNKALNQFVKNHKDIFKKDIALPEIDEDYANFLLNEIRIFLEEANSWLELSAINTGNKTKRFTDAETAYIKTIQEFYKTNREAFKINPHCDLLDGFEDIGNDPTLLNLAKILQLLYNNFHKAIDNGESVTTIIDTLLPKITNLTEVLELLTSKLDDNFNYSKLTSYDKMTLAISAFAISPKKFYTNLVDFVKADENVAPLSIQEVVANTALAQLSDPALINSVLEYIKLQTGSSMSILHNVTVCTGLGGAGKTAIVARLSGGDGSNTWVCGPLLNLVDNLLNSLPKGKGMTREELLSTALGQDRFELYNASIKKNAAGIWMIGSEWGTTTLGLRGIPTVVIKPDLKVNTVKDAPKVIVIDEATHFNTADLQIISKFATLNNIQVLLLGDDHQNGAYYQGLMMSMEREEVLAWRTPSLYISLRDTNSLKGSNMNFLVQCIDRMKDGFAGGTAADVAKDLLEDTIPKFKFAYYNKESFKGELVTKDLPADIIGKMNGSIGFIGSSTSAAYLKLLAAKGTVTLVDPVAVLGLEFDYVVIDKSWTLSDTHAASVWRFLKDLYTLTSRSREGSVIIQNDELRRFGNQELELTGVNSLKKAITTFRNSRLPILLGVADSLTEYTPKKPTVAPPASGTATGTTATGTTASGTTAATSTATGGTATSGTTAGSTAPTGGTTPPTVPSGGATTGGSTTTASGAATGGSTTSGTTTGGSTTGGSATGSEESRPPEKTKPTDIFLPTSLPTKNRIEGTDINLEDTLPEEESIIPGTVDEEEEEIEIASDTDVTPVRVYGNVSIAGIKIGDTWTNPDDSYKDLGIFVRKGHDITDNKEKEEIALNLMKIKSLFLYDTENYDRLPNEAAVFTEEAIERAEYYVRVEDLSDTNRLIGLTNLDNAKRGIGKNNKLVTLIAVLNDKSGHKCTLTLGALSNPETWEREKSNILKRILKKIDKLEDGEEKDGLIEYRDNIDNYIAAYRSKIDNITEKNQDIELEERPTFSGMTSLIRSDRILRLEEMNSNITTFHNNNPYAVMSDVQVLIDPAEFGVSESLKGKPIMFISSDPLMRPTELRDVYKELKERLRNGEPHVPRVRMLVLNNLGVSFESLYHRKYADIYKSIVGGHAYYLPFDYRVMGLRMYRSMWNFRANLKNFLEAYQNFKNKTGFSDDKVKTLCELDNEIYNRLRGGNRNFSEADYKKVAKTDSKWNPDIEKIWEFNSTDLRNYKQFRLGYNLRNGAYLRYLTGLTPDGPYKGKDLSKVVGIYINPKTAVLYDLLLDLIFKVIIDPIVQTDNDVKKNMLLDNTSTNWFKNNVIGHASLDVTLQDYDVSGNITDCGTIHYTDANKLSLIPILLTKVAKLLESLSINHDEVAKRMLERPENYSIKGVDGNDLHVEDIDNVLGETNVERPFLLTEGIDFEYSPGITPYEIIKDKDGKEIGYKGIMDRRMEFLWSFMFHGLPSTKEYNDFTHSEIRSTDAEFKYGFFSDPVLVKKTGEDRATAYIQTNLKLVGSDAIAGFPIIGITFNTPKVSRVKTPAPDPILLKLFEKYDGLEEYYKNNKSVINNFLAKLKNTKYTLDQYKSNVIEYVNDKKIPINTTADFLKILDDIWQQVLIDNNNLVVIAKNSTDASQLASLADNKNYVVRIAVAANPYTSTDTLNLLAKDSKLVVKRAVASNDNSNVEVLNTLIDKSNDRDVLLSVLNHKNTTKEILLRLAKKKAVKDDALKKLNELEKSQTKTRKEQLKEIVTKGWDLVLVFDDDDLTDFSTIEDRVKKSIKSSLERFFGNKLKRGYDRVPCRYEVTADNKIIITTLSEVINEGKNAKSREEYVNGKLTITYDDHSIRSFYMDNGKLKISESKELSTNSDSIKLDIDALLEQLNDKGFDSYADDIKNFGEYGELYKGKIGNDTKERLKKKINDIINSIKSDEGLDDDAVWNEIDAARNKITDNTLNNSCK